MSLQQEQDKVCLSPDAGAQKKTQALMRLASCLSGYGGSPQEEKDQDLGAVVVAGAAGLAVWLATASLAFLSALWWLVFSACFLWVAALAGSTCLVTAGVAGVAGVTPVVLFWAWAAPRLKVAIKARAGVKRRKEVFMIRLPKGWALRPGCPIRFRGLVCWAGLDR